MFYLKMFTTFYRLRWKTNLEYPGTLLLGFAGQLVAYGVEFMSIWVIVNAFQNLMGWTAPEVVFLFSLNLLTYGLGASFGYNVCTGLPTMVRTGGFDDILTKPIHTLFFLVVANFNIGYVTHLGLSTAMLVVSINALNLAWSAAKTAALLLTVLGGALIQYSLMIFTVLPSLRAVGEGQWGGWYWQLRDAANYPLTIFQRPIRMLFTYILPFGFISYYPAQALLGKDMTLPAFVHPVALTCAIGAALFALVNIAWRLAINRYESTGS